MSLVIIGIDAPFVTCVAYATHTSINEESMRNEEAGYLPCNKLRTNGDSLAGHHYEVAIISYNEAPAVNIRTFRLKSFAPRLEERSVCE